MGWYLLLSLVLTGVLVAGFATRRWRTFGTPWFGRLRADSPGGPLGGTGATFVAILEVERFATIRRDVGFQLANRVLAQLSERAALELGKCEIGRTGRTSIELAFRAADDEEAQVALTRLSRSLAERIVVDDVTFDLSVVIGVARAVGDVSREAVLDHAAAALAAALDRHQPLRFAHEQVGDESGRGEIALMRDFRRAIEAGQLELHYQPKLRSRTGTIDSVEALLRWPSGQATGVAVERLIRLAESTGAIRDLTEWVIDRAVVDQATLAAAGHDLTIYVNMSGVLLPDAGFTRALLIKLARAGGRIGLEVTETAVIQDPEGALANLRALADAGIKIAIDDYGSGLSSLSYLKQLPAGELKIDQMFISGLIDSHRDPLLVRSSIDLAHALDMEVTAEGVDDPLALSLLRVMGCDLVQGYLISPPVKLAELERFLRTFDGSEHLFSPQLVAPTAGHA